MHALTVNTCTSLAYHLLSSGHVKIYLTIALYILSNDKTVVPTTLPTYGKRDEHLLISLLNTKRIFQVCSIINSPAIIIIDNNHLLYIDVRRLYTSRIVSVLLMLINCRLRYVSWQKSYEFDQKGI